MQTQKIIVSRNGDNNPYVAYPEDNKEISGTGDTMGKAIGNLMAQSPGDFNDVDWTIAETK
jgi:hypothetical protein